MFYEISKPTPVQGEQHMLAENARLAAGSTQGRNEQNEQSVDGDEVEEIHVEGVEPPSKKANLSGELIDINDDSTVSSGRWKASEELSSLLSVLFIDKTLSSYARKQITKEFPRPDVESVYTPVLDSYLSSLVAGPKGVDKKPNPKLNSLANEPFPEAGKMLFGQSFEEKIKQRNETARMISAATAKKPSQQFFSKTAPSNYWSWGVCQPFGLASAPRVFTKILKPIVGLLKKQGVRLIIYLDDILLMAFTTETLTHHVRTVGICGKLSEIPTEPSPIARVSGHYDKFCNVSNQSAQRQSKEHPKGMSESHRALPK